ncbi:putative Phospo protein [Cercophora samala]|uniref:Phospo protein n=1 Tax=Cercophora samala TaxID=330535 RepID=A0AA40DFF4_9PEZI|nr:putative Phospo protein [Cercophora samala]
MSLAPNSPRLPSPPPPPEIQIGPKSPMMGAHHPPPIEQTALDANSKRRIHPGTKAADMAAGPPLVPLQELDSAFQLQEHLSALHHHHTSSHTQPITRSTALLLATPPPGIDKTLWLYELCRFLVSQCNKLIVGFLFDTPPCSASTCPEMRASEWQFLCAVHDAPKSCCAIDYCCHTLDWAANVVTNPKIFPSRFVVDSHDKNQAVKNLVNVFRRLHRIFAHGWFQHRGVFWKVEGEEGLYVFFKTVCDVYDLLPAENYKLPPEAEGLPIAGEEEEKGGKRQGAGGITIAKPPPRGGVADLAGAGTGGGGEDPGLSRTNTRRHIKSSPSTGSFIMPVPEADEDDSPGGHGELSRRLSVMSISSGTSETGTVVGVPGEQQQEEEEEGVDPLGEIPVIVEGQHHHQGGRFTGPGEEPVRPSSVIPPPRTTKAEEKVLGEEGFAEEPESYSGAMTTAKEVLPSPPEQDKKLEEQEEEKKKGDEGGVMKGQGDGAGEGEDSAAAGGAVEEEEGTDGEGDDDTVVGGGGEEEEEEETASSAPKTTEENQEKKDDDDKKEEGEPEKKLD